MYVYTTPGQEAGAGRPQGAAGAAVQAAGALWG